jgi:AcrR family transcriptional regulator
MSTTTTTDGRVLRASAQRESRRAEILDTALRVFGRKGYHHTRISDVIAEAGIARGTFYLYFESKSAIFLELLDRLLDRLREGVVGVEIGPGAPPVDEQLAETVRRIVETVSRNRLLTTIIIREAVGLDAEVDRKLREFYGNLLAYLREALDEGKRMGIVREIDTEVAAMCILGGFKQMMEQYVLMEDDTSLDAARMAQAVLDYNMYGALKR